MSALNGNEARTEPVDARVILVARGLIDRPLAAKLRLDRRDRYAIRLDAAIAAALAHEVIDDDALCRIGKLAALATTPFFSRARLIVEKNRAAGRFAQLALYRVERVAMMDFDVAVEVSRWIFVGLVRYDDDLRNAFGAALARDIARRKGPVDGLPARHRDRVVVENLVGDVDLRGDRRADREDAAVVVRPIAQIREDVRLFGERRLADPRHAFAAHVRERRRLAIHPDCHDMAADSRGRATAFRHIRRRVVRTAGAEIGQPSQGDAGLRECGFFLIDEFNAAANLFGRTRVQIESLDPLGDDAGDHRGRQLRVRRQQPIAVRAHPFALLVELADDTRTHVVAPVVELLLQLVFDDLALFLDDQNFGQAFGEMTHAFRLERPGHRDFEHANADLRGVGFGDAEIIERLPDIEVALAARHDAETRLRRIHDDAIQSIGAAVMQRGVDLVILHPRFGLEEAVGPANRHTVGRQRKIVRHDDLHALGIDGYRCGAFDGIGHAFESHPAARVATHRPAVQPEIDDLLHR